jgi:hypothetical protein
MGTSEIAPEVPHFLKGCQGISKIKPRVRHLINVKEPHFLHFEA